MGTAHKAHYCVKLVSQACQVNNRRFERHFRRVADGTPHHWMDNLRFHDAKMNLALGKAIKVVAIDVGFSGVSQFCHWFRRRCGMSASAFVKGLPKPT